MQGAQASLGPCVKKPMRALHAWAFQNLFRAWPSGAAFRTHGQIAGRFPGQGRAYFWLMTRAMSRQRLE